MKASWSAADCGCTCTTPPPTSRVMDSGNSASLQSSSGDDEFDSRSGADSSPLCALLRQPPLPPSSVPGFGGGSLIYGLQELRTPPLSHWCSTTAPLPAGAEASPSSLPGHGAPMAASAAADHADAAPVAPRGSRKRARASRRAPTTVLTTDTSNFRAMVQEFTGIPARPFAGGVASRSRFDHHVFPLRTAAGTASPATLPQYLVRPFAQKVQVHASSVTPYPRSFTSPSTSSPAPANISIAPASTTTPGTTAVASSDSYHQLTAASTSALLGMQQDHGSSNNYHSFHQSSSLGGDGNYAAHPAFDCGLAPAPPSSTKRLQDPADFLGLTHDVMLCSQGPHAHLHPRNGGDELSGLVGGASVTGAGGCKATYSSTRPLLERSRRNPSAGGSTATTTTSPVAATAGMRTQAGVVDSWVCTSD